MKSKTCLWRTCYSYQEIIKIKSSYMQFQDIEDLHIFLKNNNKEKTSMNWLRLWSSENFLDSVWWCGSYCFSNNFLCWNACQCYFFIFLKIFLTSAHQNDSKHTNHIKSLQKTIFKFFESTNCTAFSNSFLMFEL